MDHIDAIDDTFFLEERPVIRYMEEVVLNLPIPKFGFTPPTPKTGKQANVLTVKVVELGGSRKLRQVL